ncbi:hypothetical protein Tco_0091097 [Tanacetum coccineum]
MTTNLHVFIGCHTFLIDFIVLENVNEFMEKGLTEVLFGKPFKEKVGLEEDITMGVLWFKIRNDKTIFNMPHAEKRLNISFTGRIRAFEQETRDLDVEIKQMKELKANYSVTSPQELRHNQD